MPASPRALIAAICLSICCGQALLAQAAPRKVALVVGNGAYKAGPLKNPVNDAEDVAAALKEAGFETILVKNAGLADFERAVKGFSSKLAGAETGLFYYSGHGLQIDGMNFLVPVDSRIDDGASAKAQSVAVDSVIGKMESSGIKTSLVFLDSCRDNPFLAATRSGSRGLAIVATPRTLNSLVAYATSPGDVAADGEGRNGVFTGAFLAQLRSPGLELAELMRRVRAEVARASAGRQQPRVDDGMKERFYFTSPDDAAAKARAQSDTAAAELAAIDAEIAKREKAILASKSQAERQALEVEQQKAKAIEAAKRIEAQNAAKESARLEAERSRAASESAERQRSADAELARAAALKSEAERKRAEVERLARADDSAAEYLAQIAKVEEALAQISSRYAEARTKGEAELRKGYAARLDALEKSKAEPWESADEFAKRQASQKAKLLESQDRELAALAAKLSGEEASQAKSLRASLASSEAELSRKTYTLRGQALRVECGDFDREAKAWPLRLVSTSPDLPYKLGLRLSIASAADLRASYTATDSAIRAGALAGELDYRVLREAEGERYFVATVVEARVVNLASSERVIVSKRSDKVLWMTSTKRIPGSTLVVQSTPSGASVSVNGVEVGTTPFEGTVGAWGEAKVALAWAGNEYYPWSGKVALEAGKTKSLAAKGSKRVDYSYSNGYQLFADAKLPSGGGDPAFGGGFSFCFDEIKPLSCRFDCEFGSGGIVSTGFLGATVGYALSLAHGRFQLIPYAGLGLELAMQEIPAAYLSSLGLSSDESASSVGLAPSFGLELRYFTRKSIALGAKVSYGIYPTHEVWKGTDNAQTPLDPALLGVGSYARPALGLDLVVSLMFDTRASGEVAKR